MHWSLNDMFEAADALSEIAKAEARERAELELQMAIPRGKRR